MTGVRASEPAIKVLVVDDQQLVRRGICLVLDTLEGVEVVGEAADGREGLAMINAVQPDVVLTDARMPVLDGVGLVAGAASRFPGLPVVVLTTFDDDELVRTAIDAGACGFLLKDTDARTFKTALDHVSVIGHYHDHDLEVSLQEQAAARTRYARERQRVLERLSERELLFIRLVCHEHEYTYDAIADQMQVHRRTVDGYREAIFHKFGIKSKVGLVLFAFKWGLVEG